MQASGEYEIGQILLPDERLLWSGKPRGGIRFQASDALMIPFSLMWGGFAIFWEVTVISFGAPGLFALWGIPFVLIGLYMIFGRFVVDAYQRGKTAYGVTDRRVIIASGLFSPSIQSLPLSNLPQVTLSERSDHSGTITFGADGFGGQWANSVFWRGRQRDASPALTMIENARTVYDVIQRAQIEQARTEDRWGATAG